MPQVNFKVGDRVITKVRKWSVGKSKNKGTTFIKVKLDQYIDWTGWVTKDALEHTMKALEVMGFKGADLSQIQYPDALDCETEVVAVIEEIREYQGKKYYSASFINRVDEIGFMQGDDTKDLLDELKEVDTRAYITDAKDLAPPAASENFGANDDSRFTADQIPF